MFTRPISMENRKIWLPTGREAPRNWKAFLSRQTPGSDKRANEMARNRQRVLGTGLVNVSSSRGRFEEELEGEASPEATRQKGPVVSSSSLHLLLFPETATRHTREYSAILDRLPAAPLYVNFN